MDEKHTPVTPRRRLRRTVRGWFWMSMRIDDGWSDLTEHLELPSAVFARFSFQHPEIDVEQFPLLDAAFWQWVRVIGRNGSRVIQPSVAVESAWQIFTADQQAWEHLPLHVRALPYCPVRGPHAMIGPDDLLWVTHRGAHFDEMPYHLPKLFRVDEALGIRGGRFYTTDCTDDCVALPEHEPLGNPSRICLHRIPFVGMPSS